MSKEIVEAVKALEQEKGISADKLMDALEDALLSAYKKTPGAAKYARVDLDHETADFRVFELILPPELEEKLLAEAAEIEEPEIDPETGEMREPEEPELDPEMIAPYEDQISTRDVTPDDFGRIAAQTAKQVILQRIREAERAMMYDEYQDRVGELITGIIQQSDKRYTLVQLRERVEALLPKSEQVYNERYDHGMRVKAVITDVSDSMKGPSIVVSRRNPELIKKLFELEVPEIADKLVEIVGVAREPGYRSKIAVVSHADGVDPVGACVGPRGSRVRMVVSELRGEKIDIIPHNEEPARFVAKALSPGPGARGPGRRRGQAGDGDRPRRPALPGDRARRPERAPGGPAHRLAGRHQVRVRVRPGRGGDHLRGRGGFRRALHGPALQRPPLPERRGRRDHLLRPAHPPGAGPLPDLAGGGPQRPLRGADRDARRPRGATRRPWPRSSGRPRRRSRRGGGEATDEGSDASAAGPVAEEDSSSSQAAGEEPTPAPPAEEASEDSESESDIPASEAVEAQAGEAPTSAPPAEEESEPVPTRKHRSPRPSRSTGAPA